MSQYLEFLRTFKEIELVTFEQIFPFNPIGFRILKFYGVLAAPSGILQGSYRNRKTENRNRSLTRESWPQGYKTIFMLNSAEFKILPTHKF